MSAPKLLTYRIEWNGKTYINTKQINDNCKGCAFVELPAFRVCIEVPCDKPGMEFILVEEPKS